MDDLGRAIVWKITDGRSVKRLGPEDGLKPSTLSLLAQRLPLFL